MFNRETLIAQLKKIQKARCKKKCDRHKRFYKHVLANEFDKALYFATNNLQASDYLQIELLHTLLLHIQELPSKNMPEFQLTEDTYVFARKKLIDTVTRSLPDLICPKFSEEEEKLLKTYNKLLKNHQSTDHAKIGFIKSSLEHMLKHLSTMSIPMKPTVKGFPSQIIWGLANFRGREHLEKICRVMQMLSPELRARYAAYFKPEPFNWYTFAKLGGYFCLQNSSLYNIPVAITRNSDEDNLQDEISPILIRFQQEYADLISFCEAAIEDIIRDDGPQMLRFFSEMLAFEEGSSMGSPPSPITLIASKAFLNRVGDNVALCNLLNFCCFNENSLAFSPLYNASEQPVACIVFSDSREKTLYERFLSLSQKVGRHAALRKMQHIGEWCTGKNLSHALTRLNPRIDWESLIAFRDILCHPEQNTNKYKIDKLVENHETLHILLAEECIAFFAALENLIALREEQFGKYDGDATAHWKKIYLASANPESPASPVSSRRRISLEDQNLFMAGLKNDVPQDIKDELLAIFDGSVELPDIARRKVFLAYLEDKKLYNSILYSIWTPKTEKRTREQRIKALDKRNKDKKERLNAKEEQYTEFKTLRALVKWFYEPDPSEERLQNQPLKATHAALEALENMQNFLTEAGYIVPKVQRKSLQAWDEFHKKQNRESLVTRLERDRALLDALEFNIGRLSQFFKIIMEDHRVADDGLLKKYQLSLVTLRNYVEHGDPLYDRLGYAISEPANIRSPREYRVLDGVIHLLNCLVPKLTEVHKILIAEERPIASSSLGFFAEASSSSSPTTDEPKTLTSSK